MIKKKKDCLNIISIFKVRKKVEACPGKKEIKRKKKVYFLDIISKRRRTSVFKSTIGSHVTPTDSMIDLKKRKNIWR